MGNSPGVTLDFSKAQPITLDFSKAQRIDASGQAGTPQSSNPGYTEMMQRIYLAGKGGKVLPGESVTDAVSRVDHENALSRTLQNMTSAMAGQPMQNPEDRPAAEAGKKAGTIAGGLQIATGALGPLFAPAVGTAEAGTGILGPSGQEITREVATSGPSMAKVGANFAIQAIKNHPIVSSYIATHLADALGIPLPKVLKAMAGIREIAP